MKAVSSAIDWFFEQEEAGIVLEDDCLPSDSFFYFCQDLLNKYADDERIYLISGYNAQNEWQINNGAYFFSHFGGIWGWASWSRAWNKNDIKMKKFREFSDSGGFQRLLGDELGNLRRSQLESAYAALLSGKLDTWDYQWAFCRHLNGGLACVPSKSLVENIGFGKDSTHTRIRSFNNVRKHEIEFPLQTEQTLKPDEKYDYKFLNQGSLALRLARNTKRSLIKLITRVT